MKPEDTRAEAVERAVSWAAKRLEGEEAERVARFIRLYYAHAVPEDMVGLDSSDLYGAALAHLRFGQLREPGGKATARLYTPRVADHGWQSPHTAVEVVTDDMPFIVDSVRMELARQGLAIHRLVHPIIDGVSYVHVEVDRQGDREHEAQVERDLIRVLGDVRAAVGDWRPMEQAMRDVVDELRRTPPPVDPEELAEADAFLTWLADGSFTFLGYRAYDLLEQDGTDVLAEVPGTGLGILGREGGLDGSSRSEAFTKLPPEIRRLARQAELLILTKANSLSTVHRPSYLDYVGIKRFGPDGEVVGEHRFLGLFTHRLYSSSPRSIPFLRRKVRLVLDSASLPPGGHSEQDLAAILDTYPRDELVQIDDAELYDTALGILHLQERRRVRLFVRREKFRRFFSCLVFLPRDRYNTDTRVEIQRILLEALHGERIEHQTRVSESVLARLLFVVHVDPADRVDVDLASLQQRLADAVRDWSDDLGESLVDEHGEEGGLRLYHRYREAFGAGYVADNPPRVAVDDIGRLEALGEDDIAVHLYRPLEVGRDAARFKLYRSGRPIFLSDVLPLLENFGVRVGDQRPHTIRPEGGPPVWIYDFGLSCQHLGDLDSSTSLFEEAFTRLWWGEMENDGFNRLVLLARMPWRDITVLRAYTKYLRQTGTAFSREYIEAAVAAHPGLAASLVELFHVRFRPGNDAGSGREARAAELATRIQTALDEIPSLDDDRILRSLFTLIQATLRTNFFKRPTEEAPPRWLSLKLDPRRIPYLPLPKPMYEVFVYSPDVEGAHLRGGPVARGGIRWSDRREDFRTEVLGLMKAQMVKNAVIVPAGAKGGFVVKRPPAGREQLAAEVERCYRIFISGLLDVTDNRRGTEVVPPPGVVRYDGDDPYLVVAADKGTATFSDIANEVAASYGFWLGDAFASGGSAGYDHKEMGITARGAWESVKRHFRERGIDVETTTVTTVGIGDMSGDVFGNGMLLSRHLKLVAAFNHLHIFLDPDPDPETSFRERERLFRLPRSTWADYDTALLSPGGGVYPRTTKSITITPQVRAALGLAEDVTELPPNEVIRAILKAPVDLLWNGGIGTYVKASSQDHDDVGDKSNDGVRVDATELRCQVIAEGGNLGLTQRGRIEFARLRGSVNTDAIDNSAGVDCSDHEVNIKILLDAVVDDGDLTTKQRDGLLAGMTGEVANLVLADNERQTQALTNAVAQAASLVQVHARYTRWLEQEADLDRIVEALPTDEEYAERKAQGQGLTAPEFAVLLAYTKNALFERLLETNLPDDPFLAHDLMRYFPGALGERYAGQIAQHRLRREIVTMSVVSDLVDHQGITYAYRLMDETGVHPVDTARAFIVAREAFDMAGLWRAVRTLDNIVPATAQTRLLMAGRKLVERATRWLLRQRSAPIDVAATVQELRPGVGTVAALLPDVLSPTGQRAQSTLTADLVGEGVPDELAARVAGFEELYSSLDIVDVASGSDRPVEAVAATYFSLEDRLELRWLRERVNELPRGNRWETLARLALRDDLYAQLRGVTAEALTADPSGSGGAARWLEGKAPKVERCHQVLADIRASGIYNLATLSVALRETGALVDP